MRLATVALLLGATGAVVLGPFLFGEQVLLYKDIGSDSLNIEFPSVVHLSDYIRTVGFPTWSFQFGMGQSFYPAISGLLFNPVAGLPKAAIPQALAWQHLIKLILGGLFFFRFLELRGLDYRSSAAGALFLCFSTYMTSGSCWSIAANEVLTFTFLLFATERMLHRGSWVPVACAVALLALLSVFHLYLGAIFLGSYLIFRFVEEGQWQPRSLGQIVATAAIIVLLGAGLASVVVLESAHAILTSPRGSGKAGYTGELFSQPIFALNSMQHYITAIGRCFSTDLLGTGTEFRGWRNYFEAPANYCGLLCLLLLPQIFVRATPRQRWVTGTLLGIILVPMIFPWFRYLFWAFQGDYYRTLSLFGVFAIIILAATALSRFVRENSLNVWILSATIVVLLAVLWVPSATVQSLFSPGVKLTSTLFLLGYAILLGAGYFFKRASLFAGVIIALSVAELTWFSRISISHRPTVTKGELKERIGYNDHTVEAIRDLKQMDSGFYRVTKTYASGTAAHASLNDAMIFGYFGTSSYSAFNNLNYIEFLMAVDVIAADATESDTRWIRGLVGRPLLATLMGEKYILTHDPIPAIPGGAYELVRRYGQIYLYRNNLSLPFGLAYTRYIPMELFLRLPAEKKDLALMHGVALSPKEAEIGPGLEVMSAEELERSVNMTPIVEGLTRLREAAFNLRSFQQNHIEGTIRSASAAIILFPTPFDPGWRAMVDGARVPIRKVNAGLLGIAVNGGEHAVELRYVPRFLPLGAALTGLTLLLLLWGWWRYPRLPFTLASRGYGG